MTTTHTPRTAEPDSPAGTAGSADPSGHFRRLLGQRRLFGQLAECQRSHHGENTNTAMLDDIVDMLTSELDTRFPQQWRALEPELLVTELRLQHDPHDGPIAGCALCHAAGTAAGREHRRTRRQRPHSPVAGQGRARPTATAPEPGPGREAA